ncbi:MAG TPA: hypothetical protein VM686_24325, partial [Polyangiaceae bacterium]|nr:hypothetical protein [Polyangiaceae bacterium]
MLVAGVAWAGACSSADESCIETRTCAPAATGGDGSGATAGSDAQNLGGDASGAAATGGSGDAVAGNGGSADAQGGSGDAQAGSGGDGGTTSGPGGAGSGGEGGSEAPPCEGDQDCDNGVYCDGEETCGDDGQCVPGSEPCTGDPDHCDFVECHENLEVCEYAPRDADGDGYGDAQCLLVGVLGDDCNDTPGSGAAIHPGASEVCNANVDDDCDGDDERNDEVALVGSSGTVAAASGTSQRNNVSIAGNPNGGFGVVWADWIAGSTPLVYYAALSATGSVGGQAVLDDDPDLYDQNYPDITV